MTDQDRTTQDGAAVEARIVSLLAERAFAILALSALSIGLFTLLDLRPGTPRQALLGAVHAAQLVSMASAFVALRRLTSFAAIRALILLVLLLQASTTAFLGWITFDARTTPLLLVAFSMVCATMLPWSWRDQAAAVVIVAIASFGNTLLLTGTLDPAMSYPAVALTVAAFSSIVVTRTIDLHRRRSYADQDALALSESRFRELVNDLDAAVWEADLPSWNLTFLSRNYESVLGYAPDRTSASLGLFLDRVHSEDRGRYVEALTGVLAGEGYELEYRIQARDGRTVWVHEITRVRADASGAPCRVRGLSMDVSALRREEAETRIRSRQLHTINDAMAAYVEKRSWSEAGSVLLRGAMDATASRMGFAALLAEDGGIRVFAFESLAEATTADERSFLSAIERDLSERGHTTIAGFDGLFGEVLQGARSVIFNDLCADPRIAALPAGHPRPANFLGVPILVAGAAVGVIGLSDRDGGYGPAEEADVAALAGSAAVLHEGSRRAEREAALERMRTRLMDILDASPDLVSTTDPLGNLFYTNPAGRRLLGIGRDEDVTQLSSELFQSTEEWRRYIREVVPTAVEKGRWTGETTVRTRAGADVPVMLTFIAHRQPDGEIDFFSSTARDITQIKAAAEQIRALNADLEQRVFERTAQLQQAVREMEAFSYSISHDLRAPLRRIDGFCALLAEDLGLRMDAKQQDYLDRVRGGARQMGSLIDALLNLSRVTRGPLRRERVDLSALAEKKLSEMARLEPGRVVDWSVAPGLAADVDLELAGIALDNLLGNAWKYTGRTDSPSIELGAVDDGGETVFFVRDNGAGFDMTHAGKLFHSFNRLHSDEEFEGTGVGLATVDRIVRRHGGRIWAEAEEGDGATFFFTLNGDGDSALRVPPTRDAHA